MAFPPIARRIDQRQPLGGQIADFTEAVRNYILPSEISELKSKRDLLRLLSRTAYCRLPEGASVNDLDKLIDTYLRDQPYVQQLFKDASRALE